MIPRHLVYLRYNKGLLRNLTWLPDIQQQPMLCNSVGMREKNLLLKRLTIYVTYSLKREKEKPDYKLKKGRENMKEFRLQAEE